MVADGHRRIRPPDDYPPFFRFSAKGHSKSGRAHLICHQNDI
jgi:hypothetical protein